MKRSELIETLVKLYKSIPEDASSYHIIDILLGKIEREGMTPPGHWCVLTETQAEILNIIKEVNYFKEGDYLRKSKWEKEDD